MEKQRVGSHKACGDRKETAQPGASAEADSETESGGRWVRDPTVAFTYLTDEVINAIIGAVRISDFLRYLRDEWEAYELIEARPQTVEFRQRTVKSRLLGLNRLLDMEVIETHRDALCDEVFGLD